MAKKEYSITLSGSEDDNFITVELTEKEFKLVTLLSVLFRERENQERETEGRSYMPTMEIEPVEHRNRHLPDDCAPTSGY